MGPYMPEAFMQYTRKQIRHLTMVILTLPLSGKETKSGDEEETEEGI